MSTMEQTNRNRQANGVRMPAQGGARPSRPRPDGNVRNARTDAAGSRPRPEGTRTRAEGQSGRPRPDGPKSAGNGRNVRGGNGGGRPPRKSRKNVAKDKMIIMAEVLCGLLLVSLLLFGTSAIMSVFKELGASDAIENTVKSLSNSVIIVMILEILGVILLFGGMIFARTSRLYRNVKLDKKQRTVMLIMELLGILIIIVTAVIGLISMKSLYTEYLDGAREAAAIVEDLARRASFTIYGILAGMLFIVGGPVYGEAVYLRKDGETPAKKKAAAMILKCLGAIIILVGIGYTANVAAKSKDIVDTLLNEIHASLNYEEIGPDTIQTNLSDEDAQHMSGYINIAVFGVDSRADADENAEAGGLVDNASHSDVIMIVSINCDTKEVKLLSVYRDTCMLIQKRKAGKITEVYEKITHAYAYGSDITLKNADGTKTNRGPEFALNALNRNLDLNITEYVSVNFDIVRQVIEALGGLEIEVDKGELKYINQYIDEINKLSGTNSPHITKTGLQHLDGVQATGYARIRHSDSDYKRTERQREVVQKMLEKAKTMGIGTVMEIVEVVAPQIRTNINADKFNTLALDVLNYTITDQQGFPFDPEWSSSQSVVFPGYTSGDSLAEEVAKLHEFLFNKTYFDPSGKLEEISAEIDERRGRKGSSSRDEYDDEAPVETYVPNEEPTVATVEPTPTPEPTVKPTATPKPSIKPSATPKPTPTPEVEEKPTPTPKAEEPTPTPEVDEPAEPTPEPDVNDEPADVPTEEPIADEPEDDPGL